MAFNDQIFFAADIFSLKIWEEAVSYLLGCEIRFESYEEIGRSLKPFSLTVKGVSSS